MHRERLKIDKLVTGGIGLARAASGQVVMVPFVLPGEEVMVNLRSRKKDYLEGELVEILKPHPGRVTPLCPHFGVCGGCDLQHADYSLQIELKQAILLGQLQRAGIMPDDHAGIRAEPAAARHSFGYRQRLRLQVDEVGRWGFFRRRSHNLEQVDDCPLARPEVSIVLRNFSTSPALVQLLARSREIEIVSSPGDGTVVLILVLRRKSRPNDLQAATRVAAELPPVKAVFLEAEGCARLGPFPDRGSPAANDELGLVRLDFPAKPDAKLPPYSLSHETGGFSQVNLEQNQEMITTMLSWLADRKIALVADLFCGLGNFTFPLALSGIRVVGADLQRSTIRSAKRNAVDLGLTDCSFIQASAEDAARQLAESGERFDLVILDPPRRGCLEVIPFLAKLAAPDLLYISCDPATLVRDLARLIDQGYRIIRFRLIDMFPQTAHLETMVLLRR